MDKKIFLSIIVPVFNGEKTLDKCLRAIIEIRDFEKCELIVADDCSKDKTIEIAQKYKAKIVFNQTNKGVACTRNLGAKAAKGKILLFIDSDVSLSCKDILKYLKKDFESSDICGVSGVYDEKVVFNDFFSAYKHLYMCFGKKNTPKFIPVADSAMLAIPREKFLKAGGFNEKYPGVMAEDVEFSIRFSLGENKLFLQNFQIKGTHYKKYNLKSLLKTNFLRIKGISKTIQKNDYKKVYLKMSEFSSFSSGTLLFLMALTISFLILSLIYPFFLFGFFGSVLLFILVQIKFFKYLCQRKNIIFALLAVLFSFIEMFLVACFVLYLQLYYKLKK